MSTGNAAGYFEFFPEELIPDCLQLTLETWSKLPASAKSGTEDKITGRLAAAMKREKKARRLAFSIHFQAIPLGPSNPVAARIDFKFLAGFDEDAYFAFECKRLRVLRKKKLDHNTGSYVGPDGMERFIVGKYAPGQFHGAMVGYVMDGDVAAAKCSIQASIQSSRVRLKLMAGSVLESSRFLPVAANVQQTRHRRTSGVGDDYELTLQHMFLAA